MLLPRSEFRRIEKMVAYREGGCATVAGYRRDRLVVERGALSRRGHHLTVAGTGAAGVTVVGTKAVARPSQGSVAVAGDEGHRTGLRVGDATTGSHPGCPRLSERRER
jgi:hypothetical protein